MTTPADLVPDELEFFIGGYTGPSYRVTLRHGLVEYEAFDYGFEPVASASDVPHQPAPADWRAFHAALDRAGVWSWSARYEPPDLIVDGTQWELSLRCGERVVRSSGSNAYPGSMGPEVSRTFGTFLRAVRRLVGGLPVR